MALATRARIRDNKIEDATETPKPTAANDEVVQGAEQVSPKAEDTQPKQEKAARPTPPEFSHLYSEEKGKKTQYFDDYQKKSPALAVWDGGMSTKKQDTNTVAMMTSYAQSQGWTQLKVSGTKEFRREVWIEAHMRGMDVKGHKPSEIDRQEAQRRAALQGLDIPENKTVKQEPLHAAKAQSQEAKTAEGPKADAPKPEAPTQGKSAAAQARATHVDDYLRAKEAFTQGKGEAPTPDDRLESQLKAITKEFDGKGQPYTRFDVANELRARDAREFAANEKQGLDKLVVRPDMTAAENRAVLRAARGQLSDDGKIVLAAYSAKIDKEMKKLTPEAKAALKAHTAVQMAKKEAEHGPTVLTKHQREQLNIPATPTQERQNAQDHLAKMKTHIAGAKGQASEKVIHRYDQVALKAEQGRAQAAPSQKAAGPKQKAEPPKMKAPAPPPQQPKRTRSIRH